MAPPPGQEASLPLYHPAKSLPFELVQHVAIFFEEKLHTQALNLLLNVLTSYPDASSSVFIPSPQHLALAATFLVHPSTTARPKTTEEEEAPNISLRLLRLVSSLVGPVTGQFSTAFAFTHFETSRHGGRRQAADPRPALTDGSPDGERKPLNLDRDIALDLAQSSSVWSRAEDFWHAAGWAFNCAVLHPARWERWRIWLEFMCEALEDDWNERARRMEADPSQNKKILQQSMIVHYINSSSTGFGRNRRILRAIFADGGTTAVNEFREVFHRELKLSRKKKDRSAKDNKKREVAVDIDAELYGDYLTTTDYDISSTTGGGGRETKRPRRAKTTRSKRQTAAATETSDANFNPSAASALLGDMTSLSLRQRLLHLLSAVSQSLPSSFMPLQDLYHLFVENIRPLPLPIFQSFVNPSSLPHFSAAAQTTLCEFLLFRLRETAAPDTDDEYLTQSKLETCFLPYAAATPSIVDNAKMSIVLEALVMLLADARALRVTEDLKEAAQEGILRRADLAQVETRKNQAARRSEHLEWSWLIESGERLMFLLEDVVVADGD